MIDLTKPITIDPTNQHVQWILRRNVLTAGPHCPTLRKMGYEIPRRAEDELFTFILWCLNLHAMHGDKWMDEANKLIAQTNGSMCIVHPDRIGVRKKAIPCAPDGGIWVCEECDKPEAMAAVFEAYKASHGKNITAFKQTNPGS